MAEPVAAPFRIGTRDLGSFFHTAVGTAAVYELPVTRIATHFSTM